MMRTGSSLYLSIAEMTRFKCMNYVIRTQEEWEGSFKKRRNIKILLITTIILKKTFYLEKLYSWEVTSFNF